MLWEGSSHWAAGYKGLWRACFWNEELNCENLHVKEAPLSAQTQAAKGENHHHNSKSYSQQFMIKRVAFSRSGTYFPSCFWPLCILIFVFSYHKNYFSFFFFFSKKTPGCSFTLASLGPLISETVVFPVFYFTVLHSLGISGDKTCDTCSSGAKPTPPDL